ncbi:hypothetical protein BJ878DRAFT_498846 [Calycina marina]|uniref:Uncharacterized protein n=1 Tax=Calycina marina TaxID=1763456 RepID=A0A9P7Z666_9HELO|nr:hypothetical protein BJ878DRAFT_498846 [Calycina marina]
MNPYLRATEVWPLTGNHHGKRLTSESNMGIGQLGFTPPRGSSMPFNAYLEFPPNGMLLLTKNRIGTFDAALQSCIHLALENSVLDKSSRLLVWRAFVRGENEGIYYSAMSDEGSRDGNREFEWREIKNVV